MRMKPWALNVNQASNHPNNEYRDNKSSRYLLNLKQFKMKNKVILTALSFAIAGVFVSSCDSNAKKVEDAKTDVTDAKQELKEARQELNAEYAPFKADFETKIAANEQRIADLKTIVNRPGKLPFDENRKRKIDDLEQKNKEMRIRIDNYEKSPSDWEIFKKEFNHDMEGIGEAFKDLDKKNTN